MESIGLKPGVLMAFLAGLGELAAGLLFISGIMMPLASTLLIVIMLVAIVSDSGKNGYWITQNGFEYNLVMIAIAIGAIFMGPGVYAIHVA